MRTFEVQGIALPVPASIAFRYIADPAKLPEWTHAFKSVTSDRAVLETPNGSVEVGLEVRASAGQGTIDWFIRFPNGNVATAFSRIVEGQNGGSIYTFVLTAPPVPLDQLEGTLEVQSNILREELDKLARLLGERSMGSEPSQ